jgi:hypothetical protein
VAWRLSGALDESSWASLRRRPAGLCRTLAVAATEVEGAGLTTVDGLRWRKHTRLAQAVAQAVATKAVPAAGESRIRAVTRCLLITGVWLCVADGRHLQACACFESLTLGRPAERVGADLCRHLSCLRAQIPGTRVLRH